MGIFLSLLAAALGADDADFDDDGGNIDTDSNNSPEPSSRASASSGDIMFGADEKPASELIIAADGTGYPTPSDYVAGTNPYDPIKK